MKLIETNKQGYCAVCGEEIKEYMYKHELDWIDDGILYTPFVCESCGMQGEDAYTIASQYVGTNGWIPEND